jgi:uncharacterized membrane protein (UPF0127 family)
MAVIDGGVHAWWPRRRGTRWGTLELFLGLLTLVLAMAHPVAAQQTFEKTPLAIESAAGTLTFEVELAATNEQRRQGLMFRERLDSDHGMLFDFGRSAPVTMWMRNTYIPLDMLFVDDMGRIKRIAAHVQPLSDAMIGSGGPVRAVLELPAGTCADRGIEVGDRLIHPMFPAR